MCEGYLGYIYRPMSVYPPQGRGQTKDLAELGRAPILCFMETGWQMEGDAHVHVLDPHQNFSEIFLDII